MFEKSDRQLIANALKGNKKAWISLVKRYEKPLYNYSLRMVNHRADALDLMQDIFVSVFRNLASFRGEGEFRAWLFRIAHYRCVEYYRRKRPSEPWDDRFEHEDETRGDQPEANIQRLQSASQLVEAMQQLPLNQRVVVELKFFQQFTFEDIAQQLGVSSNTVKSRLYAALDKLKGLMEVGHV